MCQQRDMAVEKASAIFGCDVQNGISSWIWGPSSLSPQFWTPVLWDDRRMGGRPQWGICSDEGLRGGKLQCFLEKLACLGMGKERDVNLFKGDDTQERSSLSS